MKRYSGQRLPDGTVRVYLDEGGRRRILPHLVRHSPAGFEYGHAGAGPADLARSILADYVGEVPGTRLCRAFTQRFIEPLDRQASWTISGVEIAAWLAAVEAEDRGAGTVREAWGDPPSDPRECP